MSCDASVTQNALVTWPFDRPGVTGGRAFGSVRITATCDDERATPQLRSNEPTSAIWSWLLGKDVWDRRPDVQQAGQSVGFVTIESVYQVDDRTVGVELNATTTVDGAQSFVLQVMCRCHEGQSWTTRGVDVTFSI